MRRRPRSLRGYSSAYRIATDLAFARERACSP